MYQLAVLSIGDDAAKNLWCPPPSSNCVINLTPDKRAVLREAYRVLKVGSQVGAGVALLQVPVFVPSPPIHSLLPSSLEERCTSAMSMPTST